MAGGGLGSSRETGAEHIEIGCRHALRVIGGTPAPRGLFRTGDLIAYGARRGVLDVGLRVPDDVPSPGGPFQAADYSRKSVATSCGALPRRICISAVPPPTVACTTVSLPLTNARTSPTAPLNGALPSHVNG